MTNLPDRLHLKTISQNGSAIIMVARDEDRQRWTINVTDFKAYFYVSQGDEDILIKRGYEKNGGAGFWYEDTDIKGLDDEPLFKVYVNTPADIGKRRRGFTKTYEADVPYTRRFLIDTGIMDGFRIEEGMVMGNTIICKWQDITPLEYRNEDRQFLYDIETNKPYGKDKWSPAVFADGAVSAFTYNDSEHEEMHTFLWHPTATTRTETRSQYSRGYKRHIPWHIHWHATEREMFDGLLGEMKDRRPDTMSAWNGHFGHKKIKNTGGYDIPYLINRMPKIGLSAGNWSPHGNAYAGYTNFGKKAEKGRWSCYVDGVQLIDSMTTRSVKDGGMMPSLPYNDLKSVLRDKTMDDPEGPMLLDKGLRADIDQVWEHDVEAFLSYAFDDVDAQIVLERKEGYTEWIRDIQQFVGAEDANRLFTPMSLINTMMCRLAKARGEAVPTVNQDAHDADESGEERTGGFVMEPKVKGVQQNVAILDLDAMYVHIIKSGNLSWETWVKDPTEEQKDELICIPDTDFGPQYFLQPTTKVGLLAEGSAHFKKGREVYDEQIDKETDADVIKALKKARDPAKQLTLAVWGNSLSEFFPLYRPEVGASILGMGRYIITNVDRLLQEHGYFVTYSDTDSVFVPLQTPFDFDTATQEERDAIEKEGHDLCALINDWFTEMAKDLNIHDHSFNIGFENLLSPYAQGDQKKTYAGKIVWSEGHWQETPKYLVKGVPGIKTDAAPITQRVTDTVIKMMLNGTEPYDILQYVYDVYETAMAGDVDMKEIVRGQSLSEVPAPDADPSGLHYIQRAAWRGMREYGFEYEAGTRVALVKLLGGDNATIAIPEGIDIPDDIPIDWAQHVDKTVIDPIEGVMDWIDMKDQLESIRHGSTPTRINALP